jgi:hypothetical protein
LLSQGEFDSVQCFAYAPPGATMSRALSRSVSSFVTPVVVGKDMVPRMSLPTVHALLGDMVRRRRRRDDCDADTPLTFVPRCRARRAPQISKSSRAKVSKARILRQGVSQACCAAARDSEDQLMTSEEDAPRTAIAGA